MYQRMCERHGLCVRKSVGEYFLCLQVHEALLLACKRACLDVCLGLCAKEGRHLCVQKASVLSQGV